MDSLVDFSPVDTSMFSNPDCSSLDFPTAVNYPQSHTLI